MPHKSNSKENTFHFPGNIVNCLKKDMQLGENTFV